MSLSNHGATQCLSRRSRKQIGKRISLTPPLYWSEWFNFEPPHTDELLTLLRTQTCDGCCADACNGNVTSVVCLLNHLAVCTHTRVELVYRHQIVSTTICSKRLCNTQIEHAQWDVLLPPVTHIALWQNSSGKYRSSKTKTLITDRLKSKSKCVNRPGQSKYPTGGLTDID